ncbi:hypothetical protein RJT34_06122 [Clitoria ternatea]|uniref:Uncharacterized protein n=1 Tax=Clitoria ternatea TaxID=43366 RepID=A0AAN9K5B7_CLITE
MSGRGRGGADTSFTIPTLAPTFTYWGQRFRSYNDSFERERKVRFGSSNGANADNWNKKKSEINVGSEKNGRNESIGGGRPRLMLQPRSLLVSNECQEGGGSMNVVKPKGPNPFGEARPRERVLAEKGQDLNKIDEQLESVKIKDDGFGKKGFGSPNGGHVAAATLFEDRTERRTWRKPQYEDDHPKRFDIDNEKPTW